MVESLKKEVELLKSKALNEIDAIRFYDDLKHVCDSLSNKINNFEYDPKDELSLKKYKAYLEAFLDDRIRYLNSLITNNETDCVYDNRTQDQLSELKKLEGEIGSFLSYTQENLSTIGEAIIKKYNEMRDKYLGLLEFTTGSEKNRSDNYLGINASTAPALFLYDDTKTITRLYLSKLAEFKKSFIDNLRPLVENDIRIKEVFKKAHITLDGTDEIELVNTLENHYNEMVKQALDSGTLVAGNGIQIVQNNIIEHGLYLIEEEVTKKDTYNKITTMNLNFNDLDELLKIEKYVLEKDLFKEEFYKVIYALVEKEKYVKKKFDVLTMPLYEKLTEESRTILNRMFLERLSLKGTGDNDLITSLKKDGYMSVSDKEFEKYFDSREFSIDESHTSTRELAMPGLKLVFKREGYEKERYRIINKQTGKQIDGIALTHGDIKEHDDGLYDLGDFYKLQHCGFWVYNRYYYFDREGKPLHIIDKKSNISNKVLDRYYVVGRGYSRFTTLDLKPVSGPYGEFEERDYLVDHKNKKIAILDKETQKLHILDENLNEIKTINRDELLSAPGIVKEKDRSMYLNDYDLFSEGIIPVRYGKKVIYYDVDNEKTIDVFDRVDTFPVNYGYKNGVYNYADNNMMGYKNLDGEVVIEPIYEQAYPFFGKMAYVGTQSDDEYYKANLLYRREGKDVVYQKDTTYVNPVRPNSYSYIGGIYNLEPIDIYGNRVKIDIKQPNTCYIVREDVKNDRFIYSYKDGSSDYKYLLVDVNYDCNIDDTDRIYDKDFSVSKDKVKKKSA